MVHNHQMVLGNFVVDWQSVQDAPAPAVQWHCSIVRFCPSHLLTLQHLDVKSSDAGSIVVMLISLILLYSLGH